MLHDVYNAIAEPPVFTDIIKNIAGVMAAAGAAAFVSVPAARRFMFPEVVETKLKDHILFENVLEDRQTIRCRDGSLIKTISIGGIDLSAMIPDDQDRLSVRRKTWIDGLKKFSGDINVYISSIRRLEDRVPNPGAFDNLELEKLHTIYQSHFKRGYKNSHIIVLWVKSGTENARHILTNATDHTLNALEDFRPYVLDLGHDDEVSPLLGYWYSLLNPVRPTVNLEETRIRPGLNNIGRASSRKSNDGLPDPSVTDSVISSRILFSHGLSPGNLEQESLGEKLARTKARFLGDSSIFDDSGVVEFRDGVDEQKFMCALGLKKWGANAHTVILDSVLSVPAELIVTHWIDVMDDANAMVYLDQKHQREAGRFLASVRKNEEFSRAKQTVENANGDSLVIQQTHVFVFGSSRQDLKAKHDLVRRAFGNYQNEAVMSADAVEPVFLSLFPPQNFKERPIPLLSENVADLISFETPLTGITRNDWGPRPVSVFKTLRGTTYAFSWHKDASETNSGSPPLGHTAIIGPSGGGKTFLTSFLATSSLGYEDACVFVFDRYEGCVVPVNAFGGRYIHFNSGSEDMEGGCELNPLHMDLGRESNKQWLITWLRDHVLQTEDPAMDEELTRVVRGLAEENDLSKRTLESVKRDLPEVPELAELDRFIAGPYKGLLNARRDTLSMKEGRLVGFDFTTILEDDVLVRTVLPYIMHRIETEMAARGAPYLLVFDETHALLRNTKMEAWVIKQLQEGRKNRAVVVMCFQRVSTLSNTSIGQEILTLTPNRILLPNPEAGEQEYRNFLDLSASEFEIVKGRAPVVHGLERFVVMKRDGEGTVFLNTDMKDRLKTEKGLSLTPLFDSGRASADLMRVYKKNFGSPQWIEKYLQERSGARRFD